MLKVWTGDSRTANKINDFLYGLGFVIGDPLKKCIFCKERKLKSVHHTGAAIGSSTVLLMVFPKDFRFDYDEPDQQLDKMGDQADNKVKAVVVAMMTNLTNVGLSKTAQEIADLFVWLM